MIIIYEGPDGIGKNAFIEYEKAIRTTCVNIYEYNNFFDNTFDAWLEEIHKWIANAQGGNLVLVSRSWLSERIYAKSFLRKPRIKALEEAKLMTTLKELAESLRVELHFVVLLPKQPEDTYNRLKIRGDTSNVITNWYDILNMYKAKAAAYRGYLTPINI